MYECWNMYCFSMCTGHVKACIHASLTGACMHACTCTHTHMHTRMHARAFLLVEGVCAKCNHLALQLPSTLWIPMCVRKHQWQEWGVSSFKKLNLLCLNKWSVSGAWQTQSQQHRTPTKPFCCWLHTHSCFCPLVTRSAPYAHNPY